MYTAQEDGLEDKETGEADTDGEAKGEAKGEGEGDGEREALTTESDGKREGEGVTERPLVGDGETETNAERDGGDGDHNGDGDGDGDAAQSPAHGERSEKTGVPVAAERTTPLGELSAMYAPALPTESKSTVCPAAMADMLALAPCVSVSGAAGGEKAPVYTATPATMRTFARWPVK